MLPQIKSPRFYHDLPTNYKPLTLSLSSSSSTPAQGIRTRLGIGCAKRLGDPKGTPKHTAAIFNALRFKRPAQFLIKNHKSTCQSAPTRSKRISYSDKCWNKLPRSLAHTESRAPAHHASSAFHAFRHCCLHQCTGSTAISTNSRALPPCCTPPSAWACRSHLTPQPRRCGAMAPATRPTSRALPLPLAHPSPPALSSPYPPPLPLSAPITRATPARPCPTRRRSPPPGWPGRGSWSSTWAGWRASWRRGTGRRSRCRTAGT